MNTMHACYWPGCGLQVRREHFMCSPHWYKVPLQLRVELNRRWQIVLRFRGSVGLQRTPRYHGALSPSQQREALEQYEKAKAAVFEWIERDKAEELRRIDPHGLHRP